MPQALYRQWRPLTFSSVVGQEAVVRTLRNQVRSGALSHAYLFCGSRGTGKTSMAKILSRAVNCTNPQDGDPCGECDICRALRADATLDVVEMDAASNSRVEDVRELLENAKYPPQHGKYKVYIVDEVHMLSASAFNALLKTLEEPPEYLIFILATTEPQKLPATVLSRCQRFDFGRIPADKIVGRLLEVAQGAGAELTRDAAFDIARAAEGGMRDAINLLDTCASQGGAVDGARVREVLGAAGRDFLFEFADACAASDAALAMRLIDRLMRGGLDARVFCGDMARHLRAVCVAGVCGADAAKVLDVTAEDAQAYAAQSARFTSARLMRCVDLFMRAEPEMRFSASPRVALELCALKCCHSDTEAAPDALYERVAELEREITRLRAMPPAPREDGDKPGKPEKSEKAKSASTAPVAPVADGDAKALYDRVCKALAAVPQLFVHFKRGAPVSLKDGVLTLSFPAASAFSRDVLAQEKNLADCEQIAQRAAGAAVRLHFEHAGGDAQQGAQQRAQADVKAIRDAIEDKSKLHVE